jgi:geranylgeranyl reductase family protein
MTDYDVIICGAGPSGATSAKFISEKGYKVTLLDKASFPRNKLCGGALRLCIDRFDYIMKGMRNISLTNCFEVKMHSPSLRYIIGFKSSNPVIYHIKRLEFDEMLVNMAVDSGADLLENHFVEKVSVSKDKCTVFLKNGDKLSSKLIIGASGMYDPVLSYLRKKQGLPLYLRKSEIAHMIMQEFPASTDFINDSFGKHKTSHMFLKPGGVYGYGWLFPKDNVLNVGFGALLTDIKKVDLHKIFNKFLKLLKKRGLLPKDYDFGQIEVTLLPMSGPIRKTYADRAIVVGDAAGFISPLSGEGLYYAISSGKFAAETVLDALAKEKYNEKNLSIYQSKWQKEWGFEIAFLRFFTKNFHNQVERFMKYASLDEKLKGNLLDIYTGRKDSSKLLWKMVPRILMDFLRFEEYKIT